MSLNEIDKSNIPQHIAIIMDGNGRWAQSQGKERSFGHEHGVESVREAIRGCKKLGVKYLTLYAFSTENWNRPKEEVDFLMNLLAHTIIGEIDEFKKNNIRFETIGDIKEMPEVTYKNLVKAKEETAHCEQFVLILALNYGARKEIEMSIKKLIQDIQSGNFNAEEFNAEEFSNKLDTAGFPDPDMLIRTSNEKRISNFLLWQIAYTELFFLQIHWPEFKKEHLWECVLEYQNRERRFGKTSAQI